MQSHWCGIKTGQLACRRGLHAGPLVSEAMIAEAQRKHVDDVRFTFKQGNASALPLEAASFDAAFNTISFHHWADQGAGIRSVARVLRPNGLLVLADIAPPFLFLTAPLLKWIDHSKFPRPPAVRRLMREAGFSVVSHRRLWPLSRAELVVARKK
jgi:ubiquinone/menaquinone biosynthesis C-methylase UbiE